MILQNTAEDIQYLRVNNPLTVSCAKLNKLMNSIGKSAKEESKNVNTTTNVAIYPAYQMVHSNH